MLEPIAADVELIFGRTSTSKMETLSAPPLATHISGWPFLPLRDGWKWKSLGWWSPGMGSLAPATSRAVVAPDNTVAAEVACCHDPLRHCSAPLPTYPSTHADAPFTPTL